MRIVFWGTPETAVPFLEFLIAQFEVVGVVTRPDKPSDRGQKVHSSPVKLLAEKKKIPVLQPVQLKDPAFLQQLSDLKPDCGIVVAYGRIIPPEAIRLFPKGLFNVHFSLLPLLRGAAPMQWAIIRGEKRTGVTLFRIGEGLDDGPIVAQKSIELLEADNALTLEERLVPLGILALEETLRQLENGALKETPQKGTPSLAPLLKKTDAKIDWNRPAAEIARRVRGLAGMGAFTHLPDGKFLKILRCEPHAGSEGKGPVPSTVRSIERGRGFVVECSSGELLILRVQMEGKKETDAWSFLQGRHLKEGDRLGDKKP